MLTAPAESRKFCRGKRVILSVPELEVLVEVW